MPDRLRLAVYCPTCLPGYHIPFFLAAEMGIFAEHDLAVELLATEPEPQRPSTSSAVADGVAELALTGVTHHLLALQAAGGRLPARFVSVLHQRSPLAAVVPEDSPIRSMADLGGRRVGASRAAAWLAQECRSAVVDWGHAPPEIATVPGRAADALVGGALDAVATGADVAPAIAERIHGGVRSILVGHDVYSSGLVAGDQVPDDVAARVVAAVSAAFERQRQDPEGGVGVFCDRFRSVSPKRAMESWAVLEPFVFTLMGVGEMDTLKWAATLGWLARVHGLPIALRADVARPQFCQRPSGAFQEASR